MRQSPRSRALPPQAAAVGAYRGYRSLHQGRASAGPAPGHLALGRADRLQRTPSAVRRPHPAPPPWQDHRRSTTTTTSKPAPSPRSRPSVPRLHWPRLPRLLRLVAKQGPAARKGPARTPDARAAITLQPSSPRLQAARRRRVTAARPGPEGSRVQWYIAAPGMSFAAPRSRLAREVNTVSSSCWYAVTWLG